MGHISKIELQRAILEIMNHGNLDQLTTKKIRLLCQRKFNIDLSSRKDEIDRVVRKFVRKKSGVIKSDDSSSDEEDSDDCSSCTSGSESESCSDTECSSSTSSDVESVIKMEVVKTRASPKPVLKKASPQKTSAAVSPRRRINVKSPDSPQKSSAPVSPKKHITSKSPVISTSKKQKTDTTQAGIQEFDDAAYARKLQAEEWNFRQRTAKRMFTDIPSKSTVQSDQKKKRASSFKKLCAFSPALAELLGANEMSLSDVNQRLWAVVMERNLLDPTNKEFALCDEQLMKIFGRKRIKVVEMMKRLELLHHIKDISGV